MSLRNYIAVACVALSAAAHAQGLALGSLTHVSGAVTIADDVRAGTANVGDVVTDGARVTTGPNSTAIIELNTGCAVVLPASKTVTVRQSMPCKAQNASAHKVN